MRPRSYAIRSMSGTREGCPPPLTMGDVDTAMIHMMCVCDRTPPAVMRCARCVSNQSALFWMM